MTSPNLSDLIERVEAQLVKRTGMALSPATWDRSGPHRSAAAEWATIALALRALQEKDIDHG